MTVVTFDICHCGWQLELVFPSKAPCNLKTLLGRRTHVSIHIYRNIHYAIFPIPCHLRHFFPSFPTTSHPPAKKKDHTIKELFLLIVVQLMFGRKVSIIGVMQFPYMPHSLQLFGHQLLPPGQLCPGSGLHLNYSPP